MDEMHIEQVKFINSVIEKRSKEMGLNTNLISDGQHTFGELYHARAILFSVFINNYMDLTKANTFLGKPDEFILPGDDEFYAWKSWHHADGSMFEEYFIVGLTQKSTGKFMSYHYHKDYWDIFMVDEVDHSPEWSPEKDLPLIDTIGKYYVPNYIGYKPERS